MSAAQTRSEETTKFPSGGAHADPHLKAKSMIMQRGECEIVGCVIPSTILHISL
jgi:hypothetical protein